MGIPDDYQISVMLNYGTIDKLVPVIAGHNKIASLLDSKEFNVYTVLLGGPTENLNVKLPQIDIIYCSICNEDNHKKSIESFNAKFNSSNIPVINHPKNILKSTRDNIYNLFKDEIDFIIPKTVRITPKSVNNVLENAKEREIDFPFIVRTIGENNAKNMVKIGSIEDEDLLEQFAYDGREFYLIKYCEYISDDNLYRKYRALVIDGELILRHLIFSDIWINANFDTHQKVIERCPNLLMEEELFVNNCASKELVTIAKKLYETLGLDFFGFDFGYDGNGKIILFEANSCMMPYFSETYGDEHLQKNAQVIKKKISNLFRKNKKENNT